MENEAELGISVERQLAYPVWAVRKVSYLARRKAADKHEMMVEAALFPDLSAKSQSDIQERWKAMRAEKPEDLWASEDRWDAAWGRAGIPSDGNEYVN